MTEDAIFRHQMPVSRTSQILITNCKIWYLMIPDDGSWGKNLHFKTAAFPPEADPPLADNHSATSPIS